MAWKYFSVVLMATVKTLFAPSIGFVEGLSFVATFSATFVGGIIGFIVFYLFSNQIMKFINKKLSAKNYAKRLKNARKIVIWKKKYPVWIFVLILPFMSIPVMAVIVQKLFCRDKKVMALSVVAVALFSLLGCVMFSPIKLI